MHFDSMNELLGYAMQREEEASFLYRQAAGIARNAESKDMFLKLAEIEDGYRQLLSQFRDDGSLPNTPVVLPDNRLCETLPDQPLEPDMALPEILMYAIKKEQKAFTLYSEAAHSCNEPHIRKALLVIAEEERRRRLELEAFFEKEVISEI